MNDVLKNIKYLCNDKPAEISFAEVSELWNDYLSSIGRNIFLEIGVKSGGSSKIWELMGFKEGIGIDVRFNRLQVNFGIPYYKVQGDSRDIETVKRVNSILDGKNLDFLFIDGLHDYSSCDSDYLQYEGFVKIGGVIAFHDLKLGNREVERVFDLHKRTALRARKICHDHTGIGVFIK